MKLLDRSEEPPLYRLRVGDWRAAYFAEEDGVVVVRVFHRSDGYAWLDA